MYFYCVTWGFHSNPGICAEYPLTIAHHDNGGGGSAALRLLASWYRIGACQKSAGTSWFVFPSPYDGACMQVVVLVQYTRVNRRNFRGPSVISIVPRIEEIGKGILGGGAIVLPR